MYNSLLTMKVSKTVYAHYKQRIIRGLRKDKYTEDGLDAYNLVLRLFSPNQIGAIHRAMNQELYDLDYYDN